MVAKKNSRKGRSKWEAAIRDGKSAYKKGWPRPINGHPGVEAGWLEARKEDKGY